MFLSENKVSNFSFVGAAAIGVIGVFGEAMLLHNSLVNSYPFKMMGTPLAEFYASIGRVGYYIAITLGLISIVVAFRIPRYLTSAIPVVICPLAYWLVFEIGHLVSDISSDQMMERNFDGYTGHTARYEFGYEVLVLAFFGAIIGFSSGAILVKISSGAARKLA